MFYSKVFYGKFLFVCAMIFFGVARVNNTNLQKLLSKLHKRL